MYIRGEKEKASLYIDNLYLVLSLSLSLKAGKRGTSKKANPLVSGDDLTQKIYQTMDKHKEVRLIFKAGRYDPKYRYFDIELTIFRIDSNF